MKSLAPGQNPKCYFLNPDTRQLQRPYLPDLMEQGCPLHTDSVYRSCLAVCLKEVAVKGLGTPWLSMFLSRAACLVQMPPFVGFFVGVISGDVFQLPLLILHYREMRCFEDTFLCSDLVLAPFHSYCFPPSPSQLQIYRVGQEPLIRDFPGNEMISPPNLTSTCCSSLGEQMEHW